MGGLSRFGVGAAAVLVGCGPDYSCRSEGPTVTLLEVTVRADGGAECPAGYRCDSGTPCLPDLRCEVIDESPGACGDAGTPEDGSVCKTVYVEDDATPRLCHYR